DAAAVQSRLPGQLDRVAGRLGRQEANSVAPAGAEPFEPAAGAALAGLRVKDDAQFGLRHAAVLPRTCRTSAASAWTEPVQALYCHRHGRARSKTNVRDRGWAVRHSQIRL